MSKAEQKKSDSSTEERIKEAARVVFLRKGFAATRTRDIADEAGINLALLNYYFRSKAKLFEIIMTEALSRFVSKIQHVLDDEDTSLEAKISEMANQYIDLLLEEPEIPTFLVTEIRTNPKALNMKFTLAQKIVSSVFFRQYQEAFQQRKVSEVHPLNFMLNLIGLIVFPFIAKPLLMEAVGIETGEFKRVMEQRRKLIPIWLKLMMEGA